MFISEFFELFHIHLLPKIHLHGGSKTHPKLKSNNVIGNSQRSLLRPGHGPRGQGHVQQQRVSVA